MRKQTKVANVKPAKKLLTLDRATVSRLDQDDLADVHGGAPCQSWKTMSSNVH